MTGSTGKDQMENGNGLKIWSEVGHAKGLTVLWEDVDGR